LESAHIILGLGFGDEGKGLATDYFCRKENADLIVRYNGGSQAAHNVVTPEGRHFTFSQIGSGSFLPKVKTLVSRFMFLDPITLEQEANLFDFKLGGNILARHFIDARVPIITPYHVAINRIIEYLRGSSRHGSCGKGIGELGKDIAENRDILHAASLLESRDSLESIIASIQENKQSTFESLSELPDGILELERKVLLDINSPAEIADYYKSIVTHFNIIDEFESAELIRSSNVVFEGAQGILLDENYGFHPYTTWSTTTQKNALSLLKESNHPSCSEPEVTGIIRTFLTRHGAGPFPTETTDFNVPKTEHNANNQWQEDFRIGYQDGVLLKYAVEIAKLTGKFDNIFLTHCDRDRFESVRDYGWFNRIIHPRNLREQEANTRLLEDHSKPDGKMVMSLVDFIDWMEIITNSSIKYMSFGQTYNDVKLK